MNKNKKPLFLILNFLLLFVLLSLAAFREEGYKKREAFYLKLAPVDPRSLMQGDYMVLDYEIVNSARIKLQQLEEEENRIIKKGFLVLRLDDKKVAVFEDLSEKVSNKPDLLFVAFRSNGFDIRINADSFLFQEGEAARYEEAQYSKVVLIGTQLRLVDLVNSLP